jgi:hypothetical protein
LGTERWSLPIPVGTRAATASISARRSGRSSMALEGSSSDRRLIEHLMSTPTGPG